MRCHAMLCDSKARRSRPTWERCSRVAYHILAMVTSHYAALCYAMRCEVLEGQRKLARAAAAVDARCRELASRAVRAERHWEEGVASYEGLQQRLAAVPEEVERYAMPCHAMPCRAVLCYAITLRYAMLCCAVPCCAMLCCAMRRSSASASWRASGTRRTLHPRTQAPLRRTACVMRTQCRYRYAEVHGIA